jgi:hypothetical protein
MDKPFDRMDKSFDKVGGRLDKLEGDQSYLKDWSFAIS